MRIDDRPRLLGDLAAYYKVDRKTFKSWLKCESLKDIKPESGYYYSIRQVKFIISHLGYNDDI